MNKLDGLLSRFKNLDHEDKKIKEVVKKAIKSKIDLDPEDLKDSDIKFARGVIYLKVGSVIKSEIYLNKEVILSEIKKELAPKIILDIK